MPAFNFGQKPVLQSANPANRNAPRADYSTAGTLGLPPGAVAPGTVGVYSPPGGGAYNPTGAAPGTDTTQPVAKQLVRQQELADAFQQQLGNVTGAGQNALDQAVALAPQLTQVANDAYKAGVEAQNLDRYRGAVDTAAGARQSAVQTTLANLKNQAQLGFDSTKRSLDSQRAALGLPTESTEFHRNIGDAYYRNFLPVEAQALALQSQNIERDLSSEQALKNLELSAGAQRGASAAQLASSLAQPIGMQLNAVGQLGQALSQTAPLADRAYYNYLQGNDGLPELPYAPPSYNVPGVQNNDQALIDAMNNYGQAPLNSAQQLAAPAGAGGGGWPGVPFAGAPAYQSPKQGPRNQPSPGHLAPEDYMNYLGVADPTNPPGSDFAGQPFQGPRDSNQATWAVPAASAQLPPSPNPSYPTPFDVPSDADAQRLYNQGADFMSGLGYGPQEPGYGDMAAAVGGFNYRHRVPVEAIPPPPLSGTFMNTSATPGVNSVYAGPNPYVLPPELRPGGSTYNSVYPAPVAAADSVYAGPNPYVLPPDLAGRL